uniref:TonB-dependent receptor n=1 Tax=uncultured Draconibacterium sp. TaxID=1573823 RepID=UPI003216C635
MKKNDELLRHYKGCRKKLIIMRNALIIVLLSTFQVLATSSYSQNKQLSLEMKGATIKEVLSKIEDESEFYFLYNSELTDVEKKVDVSFKNEKVEAVLNQLFDANKVEFLFKDRHVIISPKYKLASQQKTISGKVTDNSNEPLPGVTVVVKGTTEGTVTSVDGKFSISNVSDESVLVFSFVGMISQEITVGSQTTIDITMIADAIGIEEIVAVGYGVQKKVNLTGSVQAVKSDELEARPVTNISSALSGHLSGVSIVKNSGAPGSGANITIRGVGSFGSSSPLVLVDGLETNINDVLPSDVESISVLKDAASASIYGSRAANGVILITTKRGEISPFTISYNAFGGVQQAVNLPKYVGAADYLRYENEARTNIGQPAAYNEELINTWATSSDRDAYPNTSWVDEAITGDAFQQSHVLSLNGGNQDNRFYISFGFQDQDGIIANNNFKKYSLRLNADTKLYQRFSLKTSIMSFKEDNKDPGFGGPWANILRIPAIYPAKYSTGQYGNWAGYNPIADYEVGNLNTRTSYFSMGNFALNYNILDGLDLELTPGYKIYSHNRKSHKKEVQTYDYIPSTKSIEPGVVMNTPTAVNQSNETVLDLTFQSILTYKKDIGEHHFGALAGYSQESWEQKYFDASRDNFPTLLLNDLNVGSPENQKNSGYTNDWALQSFFGRLNYNFKERFLFEANFRYDGSSRFAQDNRWGAFPSFSAAWRLSEEEFMDKLDFLDNLKLRASWGQLGNQDAVNRLGYYPFASTYSPSENYVFGGSVTQGAALGGIANKEVTWETTETTDIGIDATLLNGKIDLVFDYFYRKTKDGLLDFPIATVTGYIGADSYGPWSSVSSSRIPMNGASVTNKGFEFNINYKGKVSDFNYSVGFNLTHITNEITDLRELGPIIQGSTVLMEGEAINSYYGYVNEGFFQIGETISDHASQDPNVSFGDIKYKDIEVDGTINSKDRVVIGNPNPDYIFGVNLNLDYKDFDFTALIQGVGKVDGYRSGHGVRAFSNGGSVRDILVDRWTPDNPNAAYPRFTYDKYFNYETSDFWIQSAAYARLKNVQLGYSFTGDVLSKLNIQKVRMYITGENLLTISNFDKGYDPETRLYGYPQMKSYNIGLNVTF